MWPYWLLFIVPAVTAHAEQSRRLAGARFYRQTTYVSLFVAFLIVLAIVIGFRDDVGGDWDTYLAYVYRADGMSILEALEQTDPAYWVLNWLAAQSPASVSLVNFSCAIVFCVGLARFCGGLPRPWLAVAVAVPYMVTVVAMGYTRQAVALGFAMMALRSLHEGRTARYVLWILIGATFHKSAVLLLPLLALASTRNRVLTIFTAALASMLAYYVLVSSEVDRLVRNYVEAEYQSSGAVIRIAMLVVPAVLLLFYSPRFRRELLPAEYTYFRIQALIALAMFPAALLISATTALDRIALYLLPLQLFVFSNLPDLLASRNDQRTIVVFGIVVYYATVLFVWLNFSTNSYNWTPYRIGIVGS